MNALVLGFGSSPSAMSRDVRYSRYATVVDAAACDITVDATESTGPGEFGPVPIAMHAAFPQLVVVRARNGDA